MWKRGTLLVLAVVLLAGCSGLQPAGADVPSAAEAREGYAALESVAGTVEYQFRTAETASNTTVRVVKRPSEGMVRQRVLAPSRLAGDVTVTNGSVYWRYDASANTVTRRSVEGLQLSNTSNREFVGRLFATLADTTDDSIVTNPILPVGALSGPSGAALASIDLGGPTQFSVSYVGTRTVAGRQTHVVELVPVNGTGSDGLARYVENATYWFDAEYFYPIRTETTVAIDGNVTRSVRTYRNVTFNAGVPVSRFRFTPPANATVRTQPRVRSVTVDSVADAAANVSFPVPTPDVPPGFDLESARVSRVQNRTTVALEYANATRELTVTIRRPPLGSDLDGRQVRVGSVNATVVSVENTTVIRWRCTGIEYTVRGTLPPDFLEGVARDLVTACADANDPKETHSPTGERPARERPALRSSPLRRA